MQKVDVSLKVVKSIPLATVPEEYKDTVKTMQNAPGNEDGDGLFTMLTNDEVFISFIKNAEKVFFSAKKEAAEDAKQERYVATACFAYPCGACDEIHEDGPRTAMANTPADAGKRLLNEIITDMAGIRVLTGQEPYLTSFLVEEVKENA